jgi:3-isopropylmalate dehydratase small subunit
VALKYAGISAVIAQSFARIFYRNSFTIVLPALEIPEIKGKVDQGDELSIEISEFTVQNLRTKETFQAQVVPKFMRDILMEGGLVEYYKRHKHLIDESTFADLFLSKINNNIRDTITIMKLYG